MIKILSDKKFFLKKFIINKENFNFEGNLRNTSFYQNSSRETASKRLEKTHNIIYKLVNDKKIVKILDIGVSDGTTTYDLYKYLKKKNINSKITISELILGIYRFSSQKIILFTNENFQIFKFVVCNIIFDKNLSPLKYLISFFGFYFFKPILIMLKYTDSKYIKVFDDKIEELLKEKKILKTNLNINNIKYVSKKYDLIRAFNILNKKNFNNMIQNNLKNVKKILKPNSYFITGYNFRNNLYIYIYKYYYKEFKLIKKITF